ncbi:hypothetical protein E2C01_049515 [Portunus trituberculatus]|uniref:Uncharacterized protein n=1 Tax=Portunus trituberculatus TaxID=210409 RepID=A0A5B7G9M7_PORTR|nr:hypothetical protein [Portunus trituberculatus]
MPTVTSGRGVVQGDPAAPPPPGSAGCGAGRGGAALTVGACAGRGSHGRHTIWPRPAPRRAAPPGPIPKSQQPVRAGRPGIRAAIFVIQINQSGQ